MSTTTQPPKPKRRWCQFSLKTLLLAMLLLCLGFAWIGWRTQHAKGNRARLAADESSVQKAIEEAAEAVAAF